MISKTNTIVNNWSKEASNIQIDRKTDNIIVGNNQSYGSPTIDQTIKGVHYPNVQSALDDMYALYTYPINTVIVNTDGIVPGGNVQVDKYIFTGTVKYPGKNIGDPVIINVFGFNVKVAVGDSGAVVVGKTLNVFTQAIADRVAISRAIPDAILNNAIEVTYLDQQSHYLKKYTDMGITIEPQTVSPASPGYGAWQLLGKQENVNLVGGSGPITFFYFKRTA